MADAWSTVVTREPEYDDYTRSRVMALMVWEANRCPNCRNYDCLVPIPSDALGVVTWPSGSAYRIHQYRCEACGSLEIFQRHWRDEHENDKPVPGRAMPGDGLLSVPRPANRGGLTHD